MKHTTKITYLLLGLFIVSQFLGLFLIQHDAKLTTVNIDGVNETVVDYVETAVGPRPELQGLGSLIYIVAGVAIGTLLLLLFMRLRSGIKIWTVWYFLAASIALTVTFGVFLPAIIAFLLAILFAYAKIKYKTFLIHNITEVLLYAGIALLFAPLFDILWMIVLLLLISAYDMYAVWKSKHMIKLAKFTSKSQVFAGLLINYKKEKTKTQIIHKQLPKPPESLKNKKHSSKTNQAVLGGGDIIFPLLFAGVVFSDLFLQGFTKGTAFLLTLFIPVFALLALFALFKYSKKNKFYPAIPYLTMGCLIGFCFLQILLLLL